MLVAFPHDSRGTLKAQGKGGGGGGRRRRRWRRRWNHVHSSVAPRPAHGHHWCVAGGDTEDTDDTPPTEDSLSLPLGSLAHMSDYMLQCLHNDRRVAHILTCADYWVATLLDPRYKGNVPSLIHSLELDCKMREYKRTLVDAMLLAFPPDSGATVEAQGQGRVGGGGGGRGRQRSQGTASTSEEPFNF